MWVQASFYAFMSSSLYLFLKRFYFNELLGLFYWALIYLLTGASDLLVNVFNFNLGDAMISYDKYKDVIASNPVTGNMFEGVF